MTRTFPFLAAGLLAGVTLTAAGCAASAHPAASCPTGPVATGLAIAVGDRADSPRPSWPVQLDPQPVLVAAGCAVAAGALGGTAYARQRGQVAALQPVFFLDVDTLRAAHAARRAAGPAA